MNYISTRNKQEEITSAEAITRGLAPDGGLYCPVSIPKITQSELENLLKCDYKGRTEFVFSKFLTDFTAEEIKTFASNAYDNKFENNIETPLVKTKDGSYILELFRGPTCAFKDMALQMLPQLLSGSMKKLGEKRTACILVATSGDTGKAALDGFADVPQTKIMVYYPEDGVSEVQKRQMTTQKGENVSVCAIDGNFDDAQSAVKVIFNDKATQEKLAESNLFLSSANSINWGRLAPQIIYYVSAYCDLVNTGDIKLGDPINICVPTGNFGNILAGYISKYMGININKLICASNSNNVLTDFFKKDGNYNKNREFHLTNSPSMDILISSNLERLLFLASNYNDKFVIEMMDNLAKTGEYTVTPDVFAEISKDFDAGFCSFEETNKTIKTYFDETKYLLDTHTAVAVKVFEDYKEKTGDKTPCIIASTASPFKFADSVLTALGYEVSGDFDKDLAKLSEVTGSLVPKSLAELKDLDVRFKKSIKKEDILDEALTLITL